MTSLKIILPVALALFAIAPAAAAPRFACASFNDGYSVAHMTNDYKSRQYRAQLRAEGRCSSVHGKVAVDDISVTDLVACIRPRGQAHCVWAAWHRTNPNYALFRMRPAFREWLRQTQ